FGVVHADDAVIATGHDRGAVRGEGHHMDRLAVALFTGDGSVLAKVPQPNYAIAAAGGKHAAIGPPGQGKYLAVVPGQRAFGLTAGDVPEADRTVEASGSEARAIPAEGNAEYRCGVSDKFPDQLRRRRDRCRQDRSGQRQESNRKPPGEERAHDLLRPGSGEA